MTRRRFGSLFIYLLLGLLSLPIHAQDKPNLVRGEDFIIVPAVSEGLCVSNTFQSNMVLQRDKPIRIWGWAEPGEMVTVSFTGKEASTTADDDRYWQVELDALPANSEPETLTVRSRSGQLTLDNILVGDVWVLGGQSNMEFPLSKVENGHLEIISANFPEMRILSMPVGASPMEDQRSFASIYQWSDWSSRHFKKGTWDVLTPEIARELSAIGYVFARRIHMATNVPIGVIDTSRGGTTVETWTPYDRLTAMDSEPTQALIAKWKDDVANWDAQADLEKRIKQNRDWVARRVKEGKEVPEDRKTDPSDLRPGPIANHNHPGACYGAMMAPLEGLSVKGAIFHQGYNNAFGGTPGVEMYADVFPEMINAWRDAFNDAQLPFGILSLCTDGYPQTMDDYSEKMLNTGIELRAVQYKTFEDLYKAGDKNIGFASTYDLRRRWYHPQVKLPAGERIARWALVTQYGYSARDIPWKPPFITNVQVGDGQLTLTFDTQVQDPQDGAIVGFAIAGQDRRYHPATASFAEKGKDGRGRMQYDKSKLVLTSIMVEQPVHFRYAWARNPLANLQMSGNKDLPIGTQRSDNWPMHTVPLGVLDEEIELPMSRGDRGKLLKALREMDRQRQLTEAQRIIQVLGQQ
jgi:sialate O-acetylesterase